MVPALRTVSDVSRRVVAHIYAHGALLDGVSIESTMSLSAGSFACVGYTGTATRAASSSKTADGGFVYAHGDIVGQTGVEYQYVRFQGACGEQTVC